MGIQKRTIAMIKRFFSRIKREPRGQGFVELLLVTVILGLFLTGVVEFGFMLNHYMHVLDGAREAARFTSTQRSFMENDQGKPIVDAGGNIVNNAIFYYTSAAQAGKTMKPVRLDPTLDDDIVISVFSVSGNSIARFPSSGGWSLCGHYSQFAAYFLGLEGFNMIPPELNDPAWSTSCAIQTTRFTNMDILGRMDAGAPPTGVLLVEIFYNYSQILKMPFFSGSEVFGTKFSLVPDPIPVYVYTVMPLSSAEPTVGP